MRRRFRATVALAALLASPAMLVSSGTAALAAPAGVSAGAARVHEEAIVLDTHLDTPEYFDEPGWSILDEHGYPFDEVKVDLPRMKKGGLDGGFWAIYTPSGPLDADHYARVRDFAILRGIAILKMVAANSGEFEFATKAGDAAKIAARGKRIVYMSMENAYPLGEDLTLATLFYKMGVREMGFAHFRNNQFADSSTDPDGPKWHGLSPLGLKLLAEMNRLGIIPDASHSSDQVLDDLLRFSKTPVILSHSGCKAIFDHPRNIDDAHLRALAEQGGVIQINGYGGYLKTIKASPERDKAEKAFFAKYAAVPHNAANRAAAIREWQALEARYPKDQASFEDVKAHLLHALKVAGPDHVGIGLDWDGGGGVVGMEDITALPKITEAMLQAGYTREDVAKVWSGNVLRVLAAAEAEAAKEAGPGAAQ